MAWCECGTSPSPHRGRNGCDKQGIGLCVFGCSALMGRTTCVREVSLFARCMSSFEMTDYYWAKNKGRSMSSPYKNLNLADYATSVSSTAFMLRTASADLLKASHWSKRLASSLYPVASRLRKFSILQHNERLRMHNGLKFTTSSGNIR